MTVARRQTATDPVKVSDAVARFLKDRGVRHAFGMIGSANAHLFDSINALGYTEIVCVHHEQAATMAMQTYYRTSGRMAAALVTAGGGSTNAITGVLSAWADSIPGLIISGQENTRFIDRMQGMRLWGVQGFDSVAMVRDITKYAARITEPARTLFELDRAWQRALERRPGPVWIDMPMNVQGARVPADEWVSAGPDERTEAPLAPDAGTVDLIERLVREATRPVFWLGHGIRLAGATGRIEPLLERCPFQSLVSWAGIDLLPAAHPLNAGRAGLYGDRAANLTLQNADLVIAIGTRMAIPMIGYEHAELARAARIVQVDIDPSELTRLADIDAITVCADAAAFIDELLRRFGDRPLDTSRQSAWRMHCEQLRATWPLVGPEHADRGGFINSYRFIDRLCDWLKPDQHIVTDMGTALLSGHEALRLQAGQRLMTSTGLGEMGYGLPGAIGASFARDRGEVLCLNCDGGMMLNLQELQTVVHHQLPIKIIIFSNDGYLMIKHTQKNLLAGRYTGVDAHSGVSCPDFGKLSAAFGLPYCAIRHQDDVEAAIRVLQAATGPMVCEVFMDPEQPFQPKVSLAMDQNGRIVSPPLEDTSPLLPRDELARRMLIGLHPKSIDLG